MKEEVDIEKLFKATGFRSKNENISNDVKNILEWTKVLQLVNTDNIEPMFNTLGENITYITKEDVVNKDATVETILANAPESENNFFVVPKVIKN